MIVGVCLSALLLLVSFPSVFWIRFIQLIPLWGGVIGFYYFGVLKAFSDLWEEETIVEN